VAIASKGSRIIVVDGVRYRWAVTGKGDAQCGIVVELADSPAGRMTAWADNDSVIVPAMVAEGIRRARQDGWDPSGAPWVYRLRGSLGVGPLRLTEPYTGGRDGA
jgi:hypothetical protein